MNKYDELIEDIVDICLEKLRHDKKHEESNLEDEIINFVENLMLGVRKRLERLKNNDTLHEGGEI